MEVTHEAEDGSFKGYSLQLGPLENQEGDIKLPWDKVFVFNVTGLQGTTEITFRREDVRGKALRCGTVVSEWLPEWFASKRDG